MLKIETSYSYHALKIARNALNALSYGAEIQTMQEFEYSNKESKYAYSNQINRKVNYFRKFLKAMCCAFSNK